MEKSRGALLKIKNKRKRKKIGSNLCINTANINVQIVHCAVYHNGIEYLYSSIFGQWAHFTVKARIILFLGFQDFYFSRK